MGKIKIVISELQFKEENYEKEWSNYFLVLGREIFFHLSLSETNGLIERQALVVSLMP